MFNISQRSRQSRPFTHHRSRTLSAIVAVGAAVAVTISGCAAPGSSSNGSSDPSDDVQISARITPEQVAALGDITLTVWCDQGENDVLDIIIPVYEETFPNVTVDAQCKGYDDLLSTVLNAMNSDNAPDVTQGAQGFQIDGVLVKNGLIRPLDDVANVYGYTDAAGASISQLQWADDGSSTFGPGTIYGMSPDNQMVGIFYNKQKLADLGLDVPTTFDEFEAALAVAKQAGETPIALGNTGGGNAVHAWSVVQGAFTPAQDTVDWIAGASGSTIDNASNEQALELFAEWVAEGYFTPGYDGVSGDDAAGNFANGDGVFMLSGNWYAGTVSDASTFGFMAPPPGATQGSASNGSFGLPWHVSSKSKNTLAALAFVGMLNAPESGQYFAAVNRVPVQAEGVTADSGSMLGDLMTASAVQLGNGDATYYFDWATSTMYSEITAQLQEVMAGITTPKEMLQTLQTNWEDFQSN